jgi:hypothetical protein
MVSPCDPRLVFLHSALTNIVFLTCSFNGDDDASTHAYPSANRDVKPLFDAIHAAKVARGDTVPRRSKNGTPEERSPIAESSPLP